jgi:hypothetical protein
MTENELHRLGRDMLPSSPASETVTSPYLTAREAAAYLRISYSTFRKKACMIRVCKATGRYKKEYLDEYADSIRPRRKR